ncbi:MAG: SGNH/GDSL hydrolase family protein [Clostridia bacterium]|nr:SGNH/GDSL hydrolase family protein [Clostridia bacterium]
MLYTNSELQNIYFGAYFFEETGDGWLQAFQYSRAQMAYFKSAMDFWYDRSMASTAKTLEFVTEAENVAFDYKIIWTGSQDSFELAVDGQLARIWYVKDLDSEGRLRFELPAGKKRVTVYLPCDATVLLRRFEADGEVARPCKGEKVLWLGDSITQGFGPLRSAMSYVSVANRLLNWDILNQGIGGYVYDKGSLMPMEGYKPSRIMVALGTNQYGCGDMADIEAFYEALIGLYGEEMPVYCITPLWRGDAPERLPVLIHFCRELERIASGYRNVRLIDGFKMVPHLPEYFLDKLHPNALGCETYGRNLVEALRAME